MERADIALIAANAYAVSRDFFLFWLGTEETAEEEKTVLDCAATVLVAFATPLKATEQQKEVISAPRDVTVSLSLSLSLGQDSNFSNSS